MPQLFEIIKQTRLANAPTRGARFNGSPRERRQSAACHLHVRVSGRRTMHERARVADTRLAQPVREAFPLWRWRRG